MEDVPYKPQEFCNHSYSTLEFGDPENVPFTFCPWCGVMLLTLKDDDCKKGGCAD